MTIFKFNSILVIFLNITDAAGVLLGDEILVG